MTTNNNTTMAELKGGKKGLAKAKNNADDVVDGPYTTAKKGNVSTEPTTDSKFMKKGTPAGKPAAKGKISAEEKSSGDSDQHKGPIMRQ